MAEQVYGHDGTIHRTEQLNVELDPKTGDVVAVWFRCMALPFDFTRVFDPTRAAEMRKMYRDHPPPALKAVTVETK